MPPVCTINFEHLQESRKIDAFYEISNVSEDKQRAGEEF